MAFRKTLANRFLAQIYSHIRSPALAVRQAACAAADRQNLLPDPGYDEPEGVIRRFLQRRPIFHSASAAPAAGGLTLPTGDKLIERIRGLNRDRIRLDGLAPPMPEAKEEEAVVERGISVEEAKKVLKASLMEATKAKLRGMSRSRVSYEEFLRLCCEESGSEQGAELARSLDQSGTVIVLGGVVFLHPQEVVKAIRSVIPLSLTLPTDPMKKELKEMEAKKAEIDRQAEAGVRRELWCGLAFLVAQTAGFMRLTFWDLSWDVMEPICFYVTSIYFLAGYTFFLRTSRDPSFEGFFASRFAAKQRRLMRASGFDLRRFNHLRGIMGSSASPPAARFEEICESSYCDCDRRSELIGAVH